MISGPWQQLMLLVVINIKVHKYFSSCFLRATFQASLFLVYRTKSEAVMTEIAFLVTRIDQICLFDCEIL